jgi:hypothetical protein
MGMAEQGQEEDCNVGADHTPIESRQELSELPGELANMCMAGSPA